MKDKMKQRTNFRNKLIKKEEILAGDIVQHTSLESPNTYLC
jgi:hypothetical protein